MIFDCIWDDAYHFILQQIHAIREYHMFCYSLISAIRLQEIVPVLLCQMQNVMMIMPNRVNTIVADDLLTVAAIDSVTLKYSSFMISLNGTNARIWRNIVIITGIMKPEYSTSETRWITVNRNLPHNLMVPCKKGPYLPCLGMADRALLAGYPRI